MIRELIKDKRVLFVTTKNLDYIRNAQEISIVERCAAKSRIIGFAPQLVLPFWRGKFRRYLVVIDFFIFLYDTFAGVKLMHRIDEKRIKCAYADRFLVLYFGTWQGLMSA